MCRLTPEGYKMNDGTIIPFDFDVISNPQHVAELDKQGATKYEILMMAKNMSMMEDRIISTINSKFQDTSRIITNHNAGCPINKTEINKMIEKKISEQPKIVLSKLKKIWIGIAAFIVALTVIFDFVISIQKILK